MLDILIISYYKCWKQFTTYFSRNHETIFHDSWEFKCLNKRYLHDQIEYKTNYILH